MQTFRLDEAGKGYFPEVAQHCYWEIIVKDREVLVVQRGGPLDCTVLTVKAYTCHDNTAILEVDDWWGWGAG